ncbi:MAG: transposase [Actinomycetota bacterium]
MNFVIPVRSSNKAQFSTEQKLAILDEYDKCLERGSKAALARAVGMNANTLRDWHLDREAGRLTSRSDNLKEKSLNHRITAGEKRRLHHLEQENEILRAKLAKSEAAVETLGKASALLDAMAKSAAATDPKLPEQAQGRPPWLNRQPSKPSGSDSSQP